MRVTVLACLLLCACGGQTGAANQVANQPAPAPAAVSAPSAPALDPNAERDIRALLDRIYAPYASPNAPGIDLAQYMEPQLAATMRHGQGGVDADPFIDAQDYRPFHPSYGPIRVRGDIAETDVRVNSLGERSIHYNFARTTAGWKVADIRGGTSGSLRVHYGLAPLP